MPCKNCKHPAKYHSYNPDWKIRQQCRIPAVQIEGIYYEQKEVCNCREFVK